MGIEAKWAPQQRNGHQVSWRVLLRFHLMETIVGALLLAGIFLEIISLWLSPIIFSLVLAIPLSRLSGVRPEVSLRFARNLMATPLERATPQIIIDAARQRHLFSRLLRGDQAATQRQPERITNPHTAPVQPAR